MSTPVTLPALGESVTEGTVTRWLKQVGDTVAVDEPLLEVSTDKVDTEIPSPVAGTLLEIKAEEDETVEVGAELCLIGEEGEGSGAEPAAEQAAEQAAETPQAQQTPQEPEQPQQQAEAQPAEQESQPAAQEQQPQPAAEASPTGGGEGTEVKLPELGESVTEGTVTRWLKQVGDTVEVDEALLEVSTDKVDTEIPSPVAGTLQEIKAQEDETVEVGAVLAVIGTGTPAQQAAPQQAPEQEAAAQQAPQQAPEQEAPAQQAPAEQPARADAPAAPAAAAPQEARAAEAEQQPAQEAPAQPPAPQQAPPSPQVQQQPPAPSGDGQPGTYVTPLVRKMAAEHGVDLAEIEGSGVGGRIRKQDVIAAAEAKKAPPAAEAPSAPAAAGAGAPTGAPSPLRGRTEKMSRLRKVIAARMVESLQVSAQLTTVVEVDVTAIARLRDAAKAEFVAREGVKLSFMPFFAKAAVDALKTHPSLNAGIDTEKGEITYYDHENLAVAVDTERGLLTPVIKDAGDLSISGLAKKIADVADRTRNNKIGPDELAGGTFTLTNTGSRGALFDTPIINQPQVAILGTGSVVKRPVVIDDPNLGETIAVRHMAYLALTYDHRLVDGADAARFLSDVKARLESGQFEV
ncbi:MAG TPA: 2-oxoglutarate dehydrogenase, E2 component, dihydrolipoamide succinyltransferase [Marmoricola sp.]|nr:2-oxoglutarate dehydrogenase, E2 component, dihydrolipoamide succinyltransferase [Marmoricola sp.]